MKMLAVVLVVAVIVLGVLVLAQRHPAAPVAQVGHLTNFGNTERIQEKQRERDLVGEQSAKEPPK